MATTTESFFPPTSTVYVVEQGKTCVQVGEVISYVLKAYDVGSVLTYSRDYIIKFEDQMIKNVKASAVFSTVNDALTEIDNNI